LKVDSPEQVIQDGIFVKHESYSEENEFRCVKFGLFDDAPGVKINFDIEASSKGITIDSIFLGSHISSENKSHALDLAKRHKISIYQITQLKNSELGSIRLG
jgi:hypothetical protein